MRKGIRGVKMDGEGYRRCQDGYERVWEVSGWMRMVWEASGWMSKDMAGVRMDKKGYGRCMDG